MTDTARVPSRFERVVATAYGVTCHVAFLAGVTTMMWGLYEGLRNGLGPFYGATAILINALLLLQFPLLHSYLLGRGRWILTRLAPGRLGQDLATTTFATISSLQLLAVFLLWSPSGVTWWEASGSLAYVWWAAYFGSWLLVVKTMGDAGLGTQLGYMGWLAVARGERPEYGSFPQEGSFRYCRQPIYLAFALTLWSGPVWTPDRLVLALGWTAYCVFGPRLKERRYLRRHGEAFRRYQASTPYMIPRPIRSDAQREEMLV